LQQDSFIKRAGNTLAIQLNSNRIHIYIMGLLLEIKVIGEDTAAIQVTQRAAEKIGEYVFRVERSFAVTKQGGVGSTIVFK
jgi:hypothetical protein